MQVPLLDLKAQFQPIEAEVRKAIDGVLASQHFIMGSEVGELEKEVAEYSRVLYAIGCASGSDALLLALMAMDIQPGDGVITTPYTFFATGGAIARLGAIPVFVDIDPKTYNIDVAKVEEFFAGKHPLHKDRANKLPEAKRVKAIIPVHLYGQMADMDALCAVAKKYNLVNIEDAAQSIGAEYNGKRAGEFGDFCCFSFFPSKNLGCMGDGGMMTTNCPDYYESLKVLRLHGSKPKYYHKVVGVNSRLDTLQAAILRVKLPKLDAWTKARQDNAAWYNQVFTQVGLAGKFIELPYNAPKSNRHIYNQYVLRAQKRDELMKFLKEKNIGTEVYYPVPLHLQECFAYLGYRNGDLPHSEAAALQTLALPVYPELTHEQKQYVADTVKAFYL